MADIGLDDVEELRQFGTYIFQMRNDFNDIDAYASGQGCNKSGFTGVFSVLKPTMDIMADVFSKGINVAIDRLDATASGLQTVADRYEHMEDHGKRRHEEIDHRGH